MPGDAGGSSTASPTRKPHEQGPGAWHRREALPWAGLCFLRHGVRSRLLSPGWPLLDTLAKFLSFAGQVEGGFGLCIGGVMTAEGFCFFQLQGCLWPFRDA